MLSLWEKIKKSIDGAALSPCRASSWQIGNDLFCQKLGTLLQALQAESTSSSSLALSRSLSFFVFCDRNSSCAVYIFKRCVASCSAITTLTSLSASVHVPRSGSTRVRLRGETVKNPGCFCRRLLGSLRFGASVLTRGNREDDGRREADRWWTQSLVGFPFKSTLLTRAVLFGFFFFFFLFPASPSVYWKEGRASQKKPGGGALAPWGCQRLTSFFPPDQFLISSFLFPHFHPSSHTLLISFPFLLLLAPEVLLISSPHIFPTFFFFSI